MTESNLQEQICNYLSMICRRWNFIYFSVPNETLMTVLKAFRIDKNTCFKLLSHFKKMGMTPGVSDIIIGHDGKMYCMELKLPDTDKKKYEQSNNQIIFEANCHRAGIEYVIVRSYEEAVRQMRIWGITV